MKRAIWLGWMPVVALAMAVLWGTGVPADGQQEARDPFAAPGAGDPSAKPGAPDPFAAPGAPDPFLQTKGKGRGAAGGARDPFAEDANAKKGIFKPKQVVAVSSEFIEVPRDLWVKTQGSEAGSGLDARALREQVQGWLDEGVASYVASSMTVTRNGQRAKVQSVQEFIYPTELEPSGPNGRFPTAFETRNLGHELEVDPQFSAVEDAEGGDAFGPGDEAGGYVIELNIVPEMAAYAGEYRYGYEAGALGGEPLVIEPMFTAMQSTTKLELGDGDYRLVDAFSRTDEDGAPIRDTKVLSFVRADLADIHAVAGFGEEELGTEFAIDFEWIEVDAGWWAAWQLENRGTALLSEARGAVESELEAGRAGLTERVHMPAINGQRAKSESVVHFLYCHHWGAREDGKRSSRDACDTRNLGVTVEIDPGLAAGGFVELNFAPEMVRRVGENVHQRIERDGKWVADVTTPLMYTMMNTSSVTVAMNAPMLVAVMAPPDAEGMPDAKRKTLLFVTASR